MRLTPRQHLVLDIIQAFQAMEDSEDLVKMVGGRRHKMQMVEASDRYNDLLARAKKRFKNTDDLYLTLDSGTDFLNHLKSLK